MPATYAERHEELVAFCKEKGYPGGEAALNDWIKQEITLAHNMRAVLIRLLLGLTAENKAVVKFDKNTICVLASTIRPESTKIQLSWMNTLENRLIINVTEGDQPIAPPEEAKEQETCPSTSTEPTETAI